MKVCWGNMRILQILSYKCNSLSYLIAYMYFTVKQWDTFFKAQDIFVLGAKTPKDQVYRFEVEYYYSMIELLFK